MLALYLVGNVLIDTAGTLLAGSLVIKLFFPEVEFWTATSAAVVYTDVIQAIVLSMVQASLPGWY